MLRPSPLDVSRAPIPSSMIHVRWSALLARLGPQPKPSEGHIVESWSERRDAALASLTTRDGQTLSRCADTLGGYAVAAKACISAVCGGIATGEEHEPIVE
ncbi:hypothetical protein EYF80_028944 [Liparis tanakae]|uniref:Uncharacterized protein n=1 Tax=Liparis tanakae TaxID=230148 RepID=A0A4Z2H4Q6_9TELE|nr:hypothetical protein EYF80_028944 [Liparis tanakae]